MLTGPIVIKFMGNALHTQAAAVRADEGTTSGHYIPFFPSSIESKTIPICRDSSAKFFPDLPDFIDTFYTVMLGRQILLIRII